MIASRQQIWRRSTAGILEHFENSRVQLLAGNRLAVPSYLFVAIHSNEDGRTPQIEMGWGVRRPWWRSQARPGYVDAVIFRDPECEDTQRHN